ncbi:MAG: Mth938-like domain-containing protein [Paracoccaceae bacterium]
MTQNAITYPEIVPIDGYGTGYFRIAGQVIEGPILVLPTHATVWGGFGDTALILAAVAEIDVLFVGTGADIAHLPLDFKTTLEEAEIGYELMSSPSACRLYNIVVSEGRRIACALLPV